MHMVPAWLNPLRPTQTSKNDCIKTDTTAPLHRQYNATIGSTYRACTKSKTFVEAPHPVVAADSTRTIRDERLVPVSFHAVSHAHR
jgi:hypothetical protein